MLEGIHDHIAISNGREAVLRGTDIEVHRIDALIKGGMTDDEIMGSFPSLTKDHILSVKGSGSV